jgi:hypothetical protein
MCVSKDIDSILASYHAIFRRNHQKRLVDRKVKAKKKNTTRPRLRHGTSIETHDRQLLVASTPHHTPSVKRDSSSVQTILNRCWGPQVVVNSAPRNPRCLSTIEWNHVQYRKDKARDPDSPSHTCGHQPVCSLISTFILTRDPSSPHHLPSPSKGCCYTCK